MSNSYIPASYRSSKAALLLLIIGVGIVTALALSIVSAEAKTHALLQLILLPLVLFLISRIELAGIAAPRWVLACAAVGALCGAVFTYTHIDLGQGAFVVASLEGDQSESDVVIRRDRMRRPLGTAGLTLVGIHPTDIHSRVEAEGVLAQNQNLGGVVWGTTRWLNVSLRVHKPLTFSSLPAESFAARYLRQRQYSELMIVTGVRGIGISDAHDPATLLFLSEIIPLWRDLPGQLLGQLNAGEAFEQELRSLAAQRSHWSSFSHRALPMWMGGTYHLVKAISQRMVELGELACAIGSLKAAHAQLGPSDNLELQMAIRNNLAIARLIQAEVDPSGEDSKKAAIKLLRSVLRLHRAVAQEQSAASASASFNLSIVKGKGEHEKQRRRKGNR